MQSLSTEPSAPEIVHPLKLSSKPTETGETCVQLGAELGAELGTALGIALALGASLGTALAVGTALGTALKLGID